MAFPLWQRQYQQHYLHRTTETLQKSEFLSDWILAEPGVGFLLGIIFLVSIFWGLILFLPQTCWSDTVHYLLYLQAGAGLFAVFGIFMLGVPSIPHTLSYQLDHGYTAVWVLGLWSSLGSGLHAAGRLDRWLNPTH
ncbi:MAG: hypothetical protein AAF804_13035 [Bacteroidota bacterium]